MKFAVMGNSLCIHACLPVSTLENLQNIIKTKCFHSYTFFLHKYLVSCSSPVALTINWNNLEVTLNTGFNEDQYKPIGKQMLRDDTAKKIIIYWHLEYGNGLQSNIFY